MVVNAIENEGVVDKSNWEFVEKDHWPEKYGPVPTTKSGREWVQGKWRYGWCYDPTPGIFTSSFEYGKMVEQKRNCLADDSVELGKEKVALVHNAARASMEKEKERVEKSAIEVTPVRPCTTAPDVLVAL